MSEAPTGKLSAGEQRFDERRKGIGRVLAPLVLVAGLVWPQSTLAPEAQTMAAIACFTVVLWISEAIPLWAAALLAPTLGVAFGVAPPTVAYAKLVHPLVFLFLGGFVLAKALSVHGFDRRAALWLLSRKALAGSPTRALVGVCTVTFLFSMWISNTATAAMMVPIALGLCGTIARQLPATANREKVRRFEEGMLITLAYSASLGGMCTPIGTAPNLVALDHVRRIGELDMLRWMSFGVPVGVVGLVVVLFIAVRRFPPPARRLEGLAAYVRGRLVALGAPRAAERRAVAVFLVAVAGWLAPSILRLALGEEHVAAEWTKTNLKEGWVAVAAASTLLVIPAGPQADRPGRLLTPKEAMGIDWGSLFLLAGGMAMGDLVFESGLADAIGRGALAGHSWFLLASVILVVYMTELVSNTATTSMMLPVAIPLCANAGMDPIPVAISIALASSFAFMLPVSTPPNAIAYGTGRLRLTSMIGFGFWLDLIAVPFVFGVGAWLLPLLL